VVADGPHPIDVHVGSRIRLRRITHGLTQTDLARLVGISFQSVQKYERGENRVSASRLYEFAEALGVPAQYFFDGLGQRGGTQGTAAPGITVSAVEGKELQRHLAAIMSIDDKRLRRLVAQLLHVLSELSDAKRVSRDPSAAVRAETQSS
jgi:transcriptional regulator with XRE-family HTH domain